MIDNNNIMKRNNEFIYKINNALAKNILKLRLDKGISRKELAEIIGVSGQQLHKYEKGVNRICFGRLIVIINALGIEPNIFFNMFDNLNKTTNKEDEVHFDKMLFDLVNNFVRIKQTKYKNSITLITEALAETFSSCA